MDKIIIKFLALIGLFTALLFALNQVNWMAMFEIEENISTTEQKVGELFWELYSANNKEVKNEMIIEPVDSILTKICTSNSIDRDKVKLHIIDNSEVNAFALPNNHLIIYTGLLKKVKNESELSGVIGHELAHINLEHVMKKLVKEVGLAIIITMTSGNGNSQVLLESLKTLTSSAYDRSLEEEADMKSVDYLIKANIDPAPFADFLYSLSSNNSEVEEYMSWVSTHPYSKERAVDIVNYSQKKSYEAEKVLDDSTWQALKAEVEDLQ